MINISKLTNALAPAKISEKVRGLFSAAEMSKIKEALSQPAKDVFISSKRALNPAQMSYEKFEELLKSREKIISYEDLDEISSIFIGHRFGTSSNEIINDYLRNGMLPAGHQYWNKGTIEARVSKIREIAKKFSLDNDYKVFRGVENLDFLPEKGKTFVEKGFMSTTSSESVARKYAGMGPIIEILLPKGTNCNLNGNDCEILLNNSSQFRVLDKSSMHALLELLNPNS